MSTRDRMTGGTENLRKKKTELSSLKAEDLQNFAKGRKGLNVSVLTGGVAKKPKIFEKDNPAGALHKKYLDGVKKIKAKTAVADVKILQGSFVDDIRNNTRLLKKKVGREKDKDQVTNIKIETQRRIKAYTSAFDGKWYILNYEKMGSDGKGRSHEDHVDIGDILIDPSIDSVMVNKGGEIILAKRGVVQSGKYKGRVGFIDEKSDYVSTHTGDKVRILTKGELVGKQFLAKYKEETVQRGKYKRSLKSEESSGGLRASVTNDFGSLSTVPANVHTKKRPSDAARMDNTLTKMLLEENKKLYKKNVAGYVIPGECEGYVSRLSEMILKRMTGKKFDLTWIRKFPLFKQATVKYRGKYVRDLKQSDFANPGEPFLKGQIPIGSAIFVDITKLELKQYMKGDKKEKIAPCYAGKRHWWIYAGKDLNGEVIFIDNGKKNGGVKKLSDMRRWGDRRIYNIHDPYVIVRGKLNLDSKSRYLKAKPLKKKITYVSRGLGFSYLAGRPSGAVAVDKALSKAILEEHDKLYKKGTYSVSGRCEEMAIVVSGRVKSRVDGDSFKWKSLRSRGLFKKATARFRGTLVNSLKEDDFAKPGESYNTGKVPIGAAMYGAMLMPKLVPYMKGGKRNQIAPVIKDTERHWWVYAGRDARGKVVFVDNHRKNLGRMTLADMKTSVGNRKIINIHDPYVALRGKWKVDSSGDLAVT